MHIKIESEDSEFLHELHQYIYQHDQDILIDEHYEMIPGAHKEPVVTTLIATAISAPVLNFIKNMITEFIKLKVAENKEETKRIKDKQKHQENLLKIYFKNADKWEKIDTEKLDQLRIEE
jgi:hypothetical protein